MPFWLHQYSATRIVTTADSLYCYGVALLITCLGIGISGVYFVCPLMKKADRISKQYATLADQVSAFEKVLDQEPGWQKQCDVLVEEKSQYVADIALLQDTINDLLLMMRKQKVSCRGIQPLCTKQYEFHDSHLLSLKAKGSFYTLITLLQTLEQPQYPITLRAVHLSQTKGPLLTLDAIIHVISVKDE